MTSHHRKIAAIVLKLLEWFPKNARDLPWRRTADPYGVYVSEIMLQQTQVKTVVPYWERWMRELPSLKALAEASSERVHKLWEGLGYYTRVRNMQKAAQQIVVQHDHRFPDTFESVLALPGVGRYTAGAICSIAFNQPTPILDGNVIRVLTRHFGIRGNPKEKQTNALLWQLAEKLVVHASRLTPCAARSGTIKKLICEVSPNCSQLNQALMELGALICTPRRPQCGLCPIANNCVARREKCVDQLPNLGCRTAAISRRFAAFVLENQGRFLVRQRPAGGVNARLWEFPNLEWADTQSDLRAAARKVLGFRLSELQPLCTIKHSITRYRITLEVFTVSGKPLGRRLRGHWHTRSELNQLSFSSAHKKIINAIADATLTTAPSAIAQTIARNNTIVSVRN